MSRVQIDTQSWGTVWDTFGNGLGGLTVQLKLAGTATTATHYSAVTGGTASTADLVTDASGLVKSPGSSNPRFIDFGTYDMTVDGVTRRVDAVSGSMEDDIPGLVADAISEDGTVVAAAGAAVDDAIDERDLIAAEDVESDVYEFGITDAAGFVAFGIDPDGLVEARFTTETVTGIDQTDDPASSEDVAYAIVDDVGRLAFGIGTDGHLTADTASSIAADVISSPGMQDTITEGVLAATTSALPLVGWGDSITFGAGADEDGGAHGTDGWMAVLASDYGISIVNRGVTGDTDDEIAARQGALVFQVTVTGGSIPTSGGVTVVPELPTFSPVRGGSVTGVLGLPDGTTIAGTFSGPTDRSSLTFTRATAGSLITVGTVQLDAHVSHFDQYRGNISTFWLGVNGLGAVDDTGWETLVSAGSYDDWDDAVRHRYDPGADAEIGRIADDYIVEAQSIIANTARGVGWLSPPNRRYLVFPPLDRGEGEGIGTPKGAALRVIRDALEQAYGAEYLDLHSYLVNRGLEDGGYTPSAQDILDIAANGVPDSLRTGGVHPNIIANGLIARQVAYAIKRRGWDV
jgi:lysophospholipase L1-like esterase